MIKILFPAISSQLKVTAQPNLLKFSIVFWMEAIFILNEDNLLPNENILVPGRKLYGIIFFSQLEDTCAFSLLLIFDLNTEDSAPK